jgi:hypothetical protein
MLPRHAIAVDAEQQAVFLSNLDQEAARGFGKGDLRQTLHGRLVGRRLRMSDGTADRVVWMKTLNVRIVAPNANGGSGLNGSLSHRFARM